jgi:DNA-binding LacI/PurR family transcriptional regulator
MKPSTTIKDIARNLNLHHTTVSRALRNHPDVNEKTRETVLKMADELNYEPNVFATGLRSQKSKTIGIIVPEISHDFFSSIVSEITNRANETGYSVMICQSNETPEREIENVGALLSNRVAGIIAAISLNTSCCEHFDRVIRRVTPLVFFDRVCQECDTDKVVLDFYGGAVQVVQHLIDQGYRRIAHIGGPALLSGVQERVQGYTDTLQKNGLTVDDRLIVHSGFLPEHGIFGVEKVLPYKPDALFCVDDQVALGAMMRLREEGYRIPQQIAIAGFDNDQIAQYVDPPLTTVDIRRHEMGQAAVDLLIEQISGKKKPFQTKRIKSELIVRASTMR